MEPVAPRTRIALSAAAAGGVVSLALAFTGSFLFAAVAGLGAVLVAVATAYLWQRRSTPDGATDPSRRRFLGMSAWPAWRPWSPGRGSAPRSGASPGPTRSR